MGDDGDVLRFRQREQVPGGGLPGDDWRHDRLDDDGDHGYEGSGPEGLGYDGYGYGSAGSGELTKLVLLGDRLVDIVREPVRGSGYECAVLELEGRGLLRRPAPPPPPPLPPPHERQLAWLARIVGGDEALAALGTDPLEPVGLGVDAVPSRLRDRVRAIDERLEQWAPVLLGDEGLAAARLLLTRAVANEPALLRSDRDDVATGAVLWAVARGNDMVGSNRPVRTSLIQDVCGLASAPSARGSAFAHAVGGGELRYGAPVWMYDARPNVLPLGSPDLLLARFRQRVVALRDISMALRASTEKATS